MNASFILARHMKIEKKCMETIARHFDERIARHMKIRIARHTSLFKIKLFKLFPKNSHINFSTNI